MYRLTCWLFLLLPVSVFGADVTGTWNFTVHPKTGYAVGTPTVVFKQSGENLTGTYSGKLGQLPLAGSIKGNAVTFALQLPAGDTHFVGTLDDSGTTIVGEFDGIENGVKVTGQSFSATKQ